MLDASLAQARASHGASGRIAGENKRTTAFQATRESAWQEHATGRMSSLKRVVVPAFQFNVSEYMSSRQDAQFPVARYGSFWIIRPQ
jgi:hypothetical protein